MNNNGWKKFVIIAMIGILTGAVGWVFVEVRDLPSHYMSKKEIQMQLKALREDGKEDICEINARLNRIENKIDQILMSKYGYGRE